MKPVIAVLAVASQLAFGMTPFPRIPPYLPVSKGDAVIMLTGSTNTTGYRIVVAPSGSAEYVAASGRAVSSIPSVLAAKFFSDLSAAAPLDTVPHQMCMKSASFGTSLFMYWNHHRSPDLSCLASDRGKALAGDADAIADALHIQTSMRGVMRPMLPGEFHKPAPSPRAS